MPATLTVDTTGQICTWSRAAEQLLGYSRSEAVGKSIESLSRLTFATGIGRASADLCRLGLAHLPEIAMSIAVRKTGKHMRVGISVKALYGDEGKIIGVEATFHYSAKTHV